MGQLAAFVSGMKTGMRDKEYLACRPGASGLRQDPAYGTYTAVISLSRVNASTRQRVNPVTDNCTPIRERSTSALLLLKTDQLLLHHGRRRLHHGPLGVLSSAQRGDTGPPCVARPGSGGWGVDMMRTVVDVDQEEWSALWWQMYLDGIWPDRYHEDAERWALIAVSPSSEFENGPSAPTNAPDFKRRLRCTWHLLIGSRAKESLWLLYHLLLPGASRR